MLSVTSSNLSRYSSDNIGVVAYYKKLNITKPRIKKEQIAFDSMIVMGYIIV